MVELDRTEPIRLKKGERHTIEAVVDRLVVRDGIRVRLTDSVETALKWGEGRAVILRETPNGPSRTSTERGTSNAEIDGAALSPNAAINGWEEHRYSTQFGNADTGFTLG